MQNKKWWQQPKGSCHVKICENVNWLDNNQTYRKTANLRNARLYGNLDILGLSAATYSRPNPLTMGHRVTFNVVEACVDALAAKISKNKPWSTFLTTGGDPALQRKAKNLEQFVAAQKYVCDVHEKKTMVFRDAGVFGTGFLKVYPDFTSECIAMERVIPDEIKVDDVDAIYGSPLTLYQTKNISKDALVAGYPEHEAKIMSASASSLVTSYHDGSYSDVVTVIEAWHLPTTKDSKDGRHVICLDGVDLFDETWNKNRFPFARMQINPKLFGFFGQGIPEQLIGIQVEVNKLLRSVQVAQHLLSAPAIFVEEGSRVVKSHLNNEIGRIITYAGTKPTVEAFATMHPEIFQHIERLYQRAFELVGISQLSAQSKKPPGLDSGRALREFNDIETERFSVVGQRWERFDTHITELILDSAEQLYGQNKNFSVMAREKKFLKQIKWKDVNMAEDKYQLHVFPTSSLPHEPAGRLAYVQEMTQAGMVDMDDAKELLDFPDLERYASLKASGRDFARDLVAKIMEEGEFFPPEPYMDLAFAIKYTQSVYCRAKLEGVGEDHLELLRRFMDACNDLVLQAQAPPPAPMMDPAMDAGAAAMPPQDPALADTSAMPPMPPM